MKKRICAVLLAFVLFCTLAVPACAWDGDRQTSLWPYWRVWPSWQSWLHIPDKNVQGTEEPDEADSKEPAAPALSTPTGVSAKYSHSTTYGVADNSLQVSWNEVESARSYEVEITKADGESRTYTTQAPLLWVHAGDDDFITGCPHIYNAKTHEWEPAAARVRALAGSITSEWSQAKSIPCNAIHGAG